MKYKYDLMMPEFTTNIIISAYIMQRVIIRYRVECGNYIQI